MDRAPVSTEMHEDIVRRVRGEYLELPRLSPTFAQAQRLFGLDAETCGSVLELLRQSRFLVRSAKGRYIRADLDLRRGDTEVATATGAPVAPRARDRRPVELAGMRTFDDASDAPAVMRSGSLMTTSR